MPDPSSIRWDLRRMDVHALRKLPLKIRETTWNTEIQSRFVESVLCYIPQATIYLLHDDTVFIGSDRIIALSEAIDGKLVMTGLDFCEDLEGKVLPPHLRRLLSFREITVAMEHAGTPEHVRQVVLERIYHFARY